MLAFPSRLLQTASFHTCAVAIVMSCQSIGFRSLWLFSVALACLAAPTVVWPHATQLSSSAIRVQNNTAVVDLELNGRDVDAALNTRVVADNQQVEPERLRGVQERLVDYVLQHARVLNTAGTSCQGWGESLESKAEHVTLRIRWSCPPIDGSLAYEVTLFQEFDPAARHMVTVSGESSRMGLLSVSNPRLKLAPARAQFAEVLLHYLLSGIEHIVTGSDHIAFLVAVIVWGRKFWTLVAVVTAFTLGHSVTLTLAVMDVVNPPTKLVETLIAASIVYVAAENFFVSDIRHRWIITFLFGLVHGFAFAGVLKAYGLPHDALAGALAAFNVGVEVGQIVVVMLTLSAMRLTEAALRTLSGQQLQIPNLRFVQMTSSVILLLGVYWTIERLLA